MAKADMQVTPEEARFLRRFFRRQALPWLLVLGVGAVATARWAVPAADPGLELRLAETQAVVAAVRAENAVLRTELDAVGQRIQAAVDRRLGLAEERIAAMEKRPGGRAGDAYGVSEQVARLEERIASATAAQDTITRSNLSRLKDLEARMLDSDEVGEPVPAALAP